jgi:hypothetical protein
MSYVLRYAGQLEESARHCDAAFVLDAWNQTSGIRSCAITFILLGDYPRALNYLQFDRGSDWVKAFTIEGLVREGRTQEALKLGTPAPEHWVGVNMLLACAAQKPLSEIRALAAKIRPAEDPESNYLFAAQLAYCGETAAALDMLLQAVKGNYCSYPAIDTDPLLNRLRAEPEFRDLRSAGVDCQRNFTARRVGRPEPNVRSQ